MPDSSETGAKSATQSSEHFSLQTTSPFTLPSGLLQLRQFNIQQLPFNILNAVSPPHPTRPGSDSRSINDYGNGKRSVPTPPFGLLRNLHSETIRT